MDILTVSVIMVGVIMSVATIAPAIGQGIAIGNAMQGIARQPEAAGKIGNYLIIGLAFLESLTIYALVVALLLLFADPFAKSPNNLADAKTKVEVLKLQIEQVQLEAQLNTIKSKMPSSSAK